uniref:Ion transport domain-containing protein n=1 Tax=Caenorhabditis japonica TaxID=281687 RepID=A0A8R1HWS3_CAEJA
MVMNELDEFLDEMAIIVWQCAYLTEMAVLVYQKGFYTWAQRNTADLYRNYLVASTLIAWSLAVIAPPSWPIRAFAIIAADLFFYFSFVFATLRLMKIANVDAFFGSIVLMIKKMIPIMVKFMFVFMVFWFTYAVCHISLAGHLKSTPNITDVVWPWLIFSSGAFEIFGEADEEDKLGTVSKCSSAPLNWDVLTDSSVQCWFKTSMIPVFLFCYMLVSSVLLVNLVTALLSKKYEDIDKVSHIYWKYKLYSRLIEYEEKLWIPAPLSLVFYILKTVFNFLSKVPILGILPRYFMKILACFEGKNYAKERRKNRKFEAVMNGLISDENRWNGPSEEEKNAVQLVKDQMTIMELERKRKRFETDIIRQRFEDMMTEIESTNRFKRVRSHSTFNT